MGRRELESTDVIIAVTYVSYELRGRQRIGEPQDGVTHCMFSYSLQVLNSRGHRGFIPLLLYWLIVSGLLQSSKDNGLMTRYRTVSQHSPPNMMYPAAVDRLAS
jgi:hypothetical protein